MGGIPSACRQRVLFTSFPPTCHGSDVTGQHAAPPTTAPGGWKYSHRPPRGLAGCRLGRGCWGRDCWGWAAPGPLLLHASKRVRIVVIERARAEGRVGSGRVRSGGVGRARAHGPRRWNGSVMMSMGWTPHPARREKAAAVSCRADSSWLQSAHVAMRAGQGRTGHQGSLSVLPRPSRRTPNKPTNLASFLPSSRAAPPRPRRAGVTCGPGGDAADAALTLTP